MLRYPVIVAAAGGSTRCPEGKLSKEWQGKPLLAWLLERLSGHPRLGTIVLVTGCRAERVERLAKVFSDTLVVHNDQWSQGLSSSLKLGESVLPPGHGFLVALGDTPLFSESTLDQVLPEAGSSDLRIPTYRGQRGHPVYFPEWSRAQWHTMTGDRGAKSLMRQWGARIQELTVNDPGILRDFDEAKDFLAGG